MTNTTKYGFGVTITLSYEHVLQRMEAVLLPQPPAAPGR